ncbi:VOC family protein [Aldersonia sp. NBC_00410]|uniref:VOC family protein n=1 Tax=Aldersonia sp. NBC_00410 TaxID=2975954 RepID=UPI002255146A|nr:VOC family protein [Aldersonia sp. NBC_00410]MCX5041637.1 VOC family protein [Aldersonia sp. NBC_00410]
MDWTLELVILPVTDVDKAKDFYTSIGFNADHDHTVSEDLRFVQLTPPGSNCSIAIGKNVTDAEPGSVKGLTICVSDLDVARKTLLDAGVDASEVDIQAWGHFVYFADPDGNQWSLQYLPYRYGK